MELQLELWLAYLDILSRCNYGHKAGSQAAGKLVALFPFFDSLLSLPRCV